MRHLGRDGGQLPGVRGGRAPHLRLAARHGAAAGVQRTGGDRHHAAHLWAQAGLRGHEQSMCGTSTDNAGIVKFKSGKLLSKLGLKAEVNCVRLNFCCERLIGEVVQSRRRPLLGPSSGQKRLLAFSNLRFKTLTIKTLCLMGLLCDCENRL